jgi:hypothetical protein
MELVGFGSDDNLSGNLVNVMPNVRFAVDCIHNTSKESSKKSCCIPVMNLFTYKALSFFSHGLVLRSDSETERQYLSSAFPVH